ncbi:hypothetical protein ACFQY7_30485 [Actinomadura luteofluorescens]|uniref:hypothetical protein n=1 Tax=Actinomadura luteofluorescens TaxID=46163 RepID=UPI003633C785
MPHLDVPPGAEARHGLRRPRRGRTASGSCGRSPGTGAAKPYRCPGCDQEIAPGVGHVVAWRAGDGGDDRRHWHRPCWQARNRRTPRVLRSRNAPRY